ncbi:MAG: Alpha-D-ribose 1-methylphosphonate 5-triphosphate diphosphatase [Paracidovorax wautersii]|uniref:Alpha-D-ribose 1-methylphosphonate 5-triphosphate diphosphatase n=1 Tax=Paracidovorax wautersii TaxID=1177982 RepID=A0A7V8JNP4_9BURK|nr:MAG: Alpha-D-ribose 1-methylphosphonate 5-triphosphate diphosphatase [Paracidovorax wautersii]
MASEQILTHARLVLAHEEVRGTVVLRDGVIHDVSASPSQVPAAQHLGGDYLLPGFIELHTDNLERYMNPRPGVDWPSASAALAHDAQLVSAGITTVFDALAIGDVGPQEKRLAQLPRMVQALGQLMRDGLARADHFLHLRCEVSHARTLEIFEELVADERVRLVSVMDHTPGQRQFVQIEKYREYFQGKYHLNDAQMDEFIVRHTANAACYSRPYRQAIVDICRGRRVAMASHDDATAEHVAESVAAGMTIAEFPTTRDAADLSHARGLKVLMGAPNIVRGGSHSGNIAAADLARAGVLDILSSDYYPSSLLQAVRGLHTMEGGWRLPDAVATVSLAPARAVGLNDRGEIAPGLRADLVHVRDVAGQFVVQQVWRQGQRVF